jgi:hypothetical protein
MLKKTDDKKCRFEQHTLINLVLIVVLVNNLILLGQHFFFPREGALPKAYRQAPHGRNFSTSFNAHEIPPTFKPNPVYQYINIGATEQQVRAFVDRAKLM